MNSSPPKRAIVSPGPKLRLQPFAECDQQLVPDRVAEAVVDELEAVDVEEQHPAAIAGIALGAAQRELQVVEEERSVRESGERVVQGVVAQPLLGRLAGGDVRHRARKSRRSALGVAHRDPAAQHPAEAAVGVADAVLALEVRGLAPEVSVERGTQMPEVVGAHPVEPFLGRGSDLFVAVSEYRLPPGPEVDLLL